MKSPTSKWRFAILPAIILSVAWASPTLAASSGCYRWHSCPSATGSYVCGDTGHCSECPDNVYCASGLPRLKSNPLPVAASSTQFVSTKRTKTSRCAIKSDKQDSACTPGAVLNVTAKQVCKSGYAKSVRNVPASEKSAVKKEYGAITWCKGSACEVDHLISLELGGSNDIANLWPEAAPGFHKKDKVENYLHAQVCKGAMTLSEAQHEIATDWMAVYVKITK